ncbi:NAD(P)/FAD-dependent oxidoreductase [Chloroflexota bacterium]
MNQHSDIVVIGGGINGVCTAFYLAKCGANVTLVEKDFIAGGPSGLSSAIVRQHYSNPVTARMALNSLHVWQNFSEFIDKTTVFTKTGFLIGVRPEDVAGLKANIALQQSVGIETRFVSIAEMKEIEPFMDDTGLGGGAYEPESGYCDPAEACTEFAKAAQRLGAKIQTGVRVYNFKILDGNIVGVETDNGFIPTGVVVVAAGPWSPILLMRLGIEIPIINARVKVCIYHRPADFKRHGIWGDFITQVYLRPETGGMMLVGSISPEEETVDLVADPDNYNKKVGFDIISSYAERVVTRYPAMQRSHVSSSYASLYDITPDWHPIMDAVPGVDGLYLCAGSSGHGFKLAPAVGKMMAKLVLEGKQSGDDINLFSFDRFEREDLVRGRYEYSILG